MNRLKDVRILIVEDEEILREVLVGSLELHGAKVDSAESGNQALEKVNKNTYDIVITDIRMADGDGVFLLGNIKNMNLTETKLFVCSAYNDLTPERIKELNIQKIFAKPFDIEIVVKEIANYLPNK